LLWGVEGPRQQSAGPLKGEASGVAKSAGVADIFAVEVARQKVKVKVKVKVKSKLS
jgi:hypothetical protein